MPAKMKRRKSSQPPRKRHQKVLSDKNDFYNTEGTFGGNVCLGIMEELDVVPLEDDSHFEKYSYEEVLSKAKFKKTGQGHSKSLPHKKAERLSNDNFSLLRTAARQQTVEFSPFSKLSDEVILYIFHMLPKTTLVKCSAVCKKWRDLSYETTFWRRYDFGRRLVKPGVLEILLSRGVNTLRLAMSEIKSPVFTDSFNLDSTWCSKLLYLDLSMATVEASGVADILSVCRHLIKLSVENCTLNEDCCRNIAQNTKLTVLNMAMCSGLTSNGLYLISTHCTNLLEWNLAWTWLPLECMDAFLPFLPTGLTRINLSGQNGLDDQGLIDVLTRCRNLIELDISDCLEITPVSFQILINTCENLEHLHSSRSFKITTEYHRLLKDMKNLKNLEIFKTISEEDTMVSLRESLPDIQINKNVFSTIARPTTGIRRTSIWGLRVRD